MRLNVGRIILKNERVYLTEGDSGDGGVGELGDVSHGAADAAAAVQHLVARLQTQSASQVVLVSGNCLLERLSLELISEVEALTPTPFVKESGQFVVCCHQSGI